MIMTKLHIIYILTNHPNGTHSRAVKTPQKAENTPKMYFCLGLHVLASVLVTSGSKKSGGTDERYICFKEEIKVFTLPVNREIVQQTHRNHDKNNILGN